MAFKHLRNGRNDHEASRLGSANAEAIARENPSLPVSRNNTVMLLYATAEVLGKTATVVQTERAVQTVQGGNKAHGII